MKNNKKLIIAITSLCLVVVAAVAAVVGILAATSVNVNSKLYVTYTPAEHVMATVTSSYTIGGSTTSLGSSTFNYGGTAKSAAFNKTDIELDDTNTYVIFAFSFRNNAGADNTNSQYLHVSIPTTPTGTNMTVATKYATSALGTISNTTFNNLTDAGSSKLANIGIGSTVYMYTMVSIKSGLQGSWGNASGNVFSFTLTTTAASK